MPATSIDLTDRTILITGASRGIGESIARTAAAHGANVVLSSRKQEALDEVAASIRADGGVAFPHAAHAGQEEAIAELFQKAIDEFGKVDGIVNNAATNPYFGPTVDITDAQFDKTVEVNMRGYLRVIQHFVRHARERGDGGSIVSMASIAGMGSAVLQGVYGMTKAAVISMTKTLATELSGDGIRVNCISPGLIHTKFAGALVENDGIRGQIEQRTPLGRVGQPEEIAVAACYLLSDASSYVTGENLVIDGGLTIGAI